jgi:hypothetical protein
MELFGSLGPWSQPNGLDVGIEVDMELNFAMRLICSGINYSI